MVNKITIESFKSIEKVDVELGRVNLFVGANGSGKSNLLEAVGVLSAAAGGRVDDEALMRRGVRPGLPRLYKCALKGARQTPHITFGAESAHAAYKVSLFNPLTDPKPAWRFHTESWTRDSQTLVSRSHRMKSKPNPEGGLAALKAVDLDEGDPALKLLDALRAKQTHQPYVASRLSFNRESLWAFPAADCHKRFSPCSAPFVEILKKDSSLEPSVA
ncbi:MAG: DNA replication and repair protein RecF [Nitrospira sp.]|nr:DNA replication and repair protein RecF [Nitrospira sp.]